MHAESDKSRLKIGDRVRVTGVPPDLPGPHGDDLHTQEIFERCVGRVFPVTGLQGERLELRVGAVVGATASAHKIWIEPDFVDLVGETENSR